jgi:hypothetical protein
MARARVVASQGLQRVWAGAMGGARVSGRRNTCEATGGANKAVPRSSTVRYAPPREYEGGHGSTERRRTVALVLDLVPVPVR